MNVALNAWIPVVTLSGVRKLISLREVFEKGEVYLDLAVRPHERVALMRLFICIAHAALNGPKDYDEWCEVPKHLSEAAVNYLEKWKDSFYLFHTTKPWLQVAELKILPSDEKKTTDDEKCWSFLNKLCFTRSSGNNSTLFDHTSNSETPTKYSPAEIALNLLTFQNFFVAGGKASSRLWGDFVIDNPPNPKGGPCSGKSIIFTFIRGKNLRESIHFNLNTFDDLKLIYTDIENWMGRPLWENPIKSPKDNDSIRNATLTHLGRLVPQTRMIRIKEDCIHVLLGPGFLYPKFQDEKNPFFPDLFATTILNKSGEIGLLSAKPSISLWRQLHSLIVRQKSFSNKNRGSLCLLNIPNADSCDIIVNAMLTNPKQAAEIVDLLESVFHIPSKLCSDVGILTYGKEVRVAESLAGRLGWAIEGYREKIDGGWKGRIKSAGPNSILLKVKLHSTAYIHYWTTAENNLSLLMNYVESIGTDKVNQTKEKWRKMLFTTACDAYRTVCGQETPRQIKAFTEGWSRLVSMKIDSTATIHKREEIN